MGISKCSTSVTSVYMVYFGFQGKRPVAVTSPVSFSYNSNALSNRDLCHYCSNSFYFIS